MVADYSTAAGQKALNDVLAEKSYLEGYQPSQADVTAFNAVGKAPAANLPHLARWYKHISSYSEDEKKAFPGTPTPAPAAAKPTAAADDDDIDLFASDEEEDAEAERIKQERVKAYSEKKTKKPAIIAKSSVILDVKPWDDETDMAELEKQVRTIIMDGLVWGQGRLVPLAYGIKKLSIMCVVEDDKVSIEELTEKITEFEDFVQSVDIAAFNKI